MILLFNFVLAILAIVAWKEPTLFFASIIAAALLLSMAYLAVERIKPMRTQL
jgi:hypothetical protein